MRGEDHHFLAPLRVPSGHDADDVCGLEPWGGAVEAGVRDDAGGDGCEVAARGARDEFGEIDAGVGEHVAQRAPADPALEAERFAANVGGEGQHVGAPGCGDHTPGVAGAIGRVDEQRSGGALSPGLLEPSSRAAMYAAAVAPPRVPGARPSSRSCARKACGRGCRLA